MSNAKPKWKTVGKKRGVSFQDTVGRLEALGIPYTIAEEVDGDSVNAVINWRMPADFDQAKVYAILEADQATAAALIEEWKKTHRGVEGETTGGVLI